MRKSSEKASKYMLPGKTDETNPADWFYFAMDRLRIADLAWSHEGMTPAGIELLQEAAERLLKGYLIGNGWPLVKTHDLQELLVSAAQYEISFERFKRLAADLTEDFFAQHYPGKDLGRMGDQYELNRREIDELLQLIRTRMPQFAKDLTLQKK